MKKTPKLCADVLTSLSKYDTPTICNAIELFNVRSHTNGYMDGSISCCFPQLPPMVGYAVTATFRASDSSGGGCYQTLIEQVEDVLALGVPAVVVIEDLDKPSVAATFGDMMCSSYKAFGVVGIISSGAGRDLEQVEAIGLPAFAGSMICSHGYCSIVETGTPVQVGGITIEPGELLHGDRNGVTTIPHEIASEVPEACATVVESEKSVLDYLSGDSFTTQDLAAAWEKWNNLRKGFEKSFSRKSN